jgi:transcriptional regulator with XRE-family HTH domain
MAPINQGELPDAEVADGAALELGSTIRALRRQAGLTVEQLAGNVGVSRSLISAIELGRAGPSIGTLRGIAQALNVPMAALFTGDADPSVADGNGSGQRMVVRRHARKRISTRRSGISYELLTPDVNRQVEFFWAEFEPGSSAPPGRGEFTAHVGEENALCLHGSVVMIIGTTEFTVNDGDSISFDCSVPHRLENRGAETATLIFAISPPSF